MRTLGYVWYGSSERKIGIVLVQTDNMQYHACIGDADFTLINNEEGAIEYVISTGVDFPAQEAVLLIEKSGTCLDNVFFPHSVTYGGSLKEKLTAETAKLIYAEKYFTSLGALEQYNMINNYLGIGKHMDTLAISGVRQLEVMPDDLRLGMLDWIYRVYFTCVVAVNVYDYEDQYDFTYDDLQEGLETGVYTLFSHVDNIEHILKDLVVREFSVPEALDVFLEGLKVSGIIHCRILAHQYSILSRYIHKCLETNR